MTFLRILSPEEVQALITDYVYGWTVKELSVIYRVSTRTVYRYLDRYGVPSNKPKKRRRTSRKKPERELKPCGTDAAYQRHRRQGEYPCTKCLEAHAQKVNQFRNGASDGNG